ncbi:thyroid stimulating hormone subunit beta a [Gouania willdenowi]|uniref:Gonadotropin subunit beta-2 n=1 Tax=Gouania willdenowi TaxID=441366 RepID=A0A8C5HR35_GOUWI|nr:thyrotropin subunit beta-like [Gouania willdenowi]XP_028303906.1 thyrotropin subunit beta-like [Gouania willdenowi]
MDSAVLTFWLLSLLFMPAVPQCVLSNFTIHVEKPECKFCAAINTAVCEGFCPSEELSRMEEGRSVVHQSVCFYEEVEYRTAVLPGCSKLSDAAFSYPVAVRCHCGHCRTSISQCTVRAGRERDKCIKPVKWVRRYLGQSSHLIPF